MLTYLDIKNFKIAKKISLDFEPNMTVITGETGAGKSIIISALELALGGRSGIKTLYQGATTCEITAIFNISGQTKLFDFINEKQLGETLAIDKETNISTTELIIKRIIDNKGRSKISVNDTICTIQTVRDLGERLLNIHGQHEQQNLLKPQNQQQLLDVFANNLKLCEELKTIYTEWLEISKKIADLKSLNNDNHQMRLDFVKFQLSELEELNIVENEIQQLHDEHITLSSAGELIDTFNNIIYMTTENEDFAILNNLNSIAAQLGKVNPQSSKAKNILELFTNAIIQVEEATDELRDHLNSIETNQERLEFVETRLNKIHEIARKHRVMPEELQKLHGNLKDELLQLENADNVIQKFQGQSQQLEKTYFELAKELSNRRKIAAKKLNKLISEKIQLLGMEGGEFLINFTENKTTSPHPGGLETVEFLVTANRGQQPAALNKVASGGELSRISLAIQVITAEKYVTPILIFDEVDVGIGGKTAEIVGKLLNDLGKTAQIICITHLPQVACQGQQHLKVAKQESEADKVATPLIKIEKLSHEQRIQEIARQLSGSKISQLALKHAEEMLATNLKNIQT